jgi:hypothetical protein
MVAMDDLGRPWLMAIELKTGDPTGHILPCRGEPQWRGVTDDQIPPQQYLGVPKDQWGQPAWGRLEIDWDHWRDDVDRALKAWQANLWRLGQKVYQSKFDPKTAEEDDYLMTLAGAKPVPALADLDKWAKARKRAVVPA